MYIYILYIIYYILYIVHMIIHIYIEREIETETSRSFFISSSNIKNKKRTEFIY